MTSTPAQTEEEISLFALGAALVRSRWRIVRWTFLGGLLAALTVISKPLIYTATFSFVPQGNDAARSGLAALAGQLGISTGGAGSSQSPDFYMSLLKSRELLRPIVHDTFVVAEMDGRRVPFLQLFEIREGSPEEREEAAITALSRMIKPSVAVKTGVVYAATSTRWRSVSLGISNQLLTGINEFNLRTRQGAAGSERKFVETLLAARQKELRSAEDRLQEFLNTNRGALSPQQNFERGRLDREVGVQNQVYASLAQANEDARIREVRDTPTITVFESPFASTLPDARGRLKRGLLGMFLGAALGMVLVLTSLLMRRRREVGDPDAAEFFGAVGEVKDTMLNRLRPRRKS